jgi:nucleoid-associated protein YgaU
MTLAKIEITPLDQNGVKQEAKKVQALFNPNSYSIGKSVSWNEQRSVTHNAPMIEFGGGGSRELSLELFYDVTEPVNGKKENDVRKLTDKLVALARIKREIGRPPVIVVSWGDDSSSRFDFPFTGVVTSLKQNFTLFSSDGKPLRATLTLSIKEFLDWEKDKKETDPEFTTRLVKRGDTLSSIANSVYRDPGLWRVIAETNQIDDPRRLTIGARLAIPKLD